MADDIFLSRVTHDLRGELATMIAGIHYLQRYEPGLTGAGRQMLDRVNGAGQRQRRLLDELELAGWIGGGPSRAALAPEACRLEPLVQAALGRIEAAVAQSGASLEVDIPTDLPELTADPELLGVAVEFMLDFAVARSRGRTVRVAAAVEDGALLLRVLDEGGAVDDATIARLFEPFYEKELIARPQPGTRRRDRLGLGLAVAQGILVAHRGALSGAAAGGGISLAGSLPLTGV